VFGLAGAIGILRPWLRHSLCFRTSILGAFPKIKDVAIIGVPHDKWGEAVQAVVVLHDGQTASEQEILDWCRNRMAGFKRPQRIVFIDDAEMPRTATGKIQHRLLRERLLAPAEA